MSCDTPAQAFAFGSPHEALQALIGRCDAVGRASIAYDTAWGRVLSRPILADRDSPPSDVSAMDGYAVRAALLKPGGELAVVREVPIGQPAPEMPAEGCLKITTGACVPAGCDGVIPREQVAEGAGRIRVPESLVFKQGQHIRQRGENSRAGDVAVQPGSAITPPVASALAAFGHAEVEVYRPVRIGVLTTGNELHAVGSSPEPWQIRDSNSATLLAGLANKAYLQVVLTDRVRDDRAAVAEALTGAAQRCDLLVTTGGVSMGDHDYLKPALLDAGGEVVYHKLPIRPGKPGLGGLLPSCGQGHSTVVLALPGNPVAVAVGLTLFVDPVARALAGLARPIPSRPKVTLARPPAKPLGLWRYLPARMIGHGVAELITTQGSGDLANAAAAEGYVELPPDRVGTGPWVFYDA